MKKIFFLGLLLSAFFISGAQTSWSVSCSGKPILKNASEAPQKNVLSIKRSSLKKSGNITISFDKADSTSIRTLMADDSNRSGIKSWEDVTKPVVITNAELKQLFTGRNTIHFYFTEIPRDPAKAALVRVRPVHLCTVSAQ